MAVFDRVMGDVDALAKEMRGVGCPHCLRPYETSAPETQN
jgi:hypothetical protein